MAIASVQTPIVASATTGTSASATWGSTTTAGSLLVALLAHSSATATITPPSGWTLQKGPGSANSLTPGSSIYYIANSSARSGAEAFTVTNGAWLLELREYSGADSVPSDVSQNAFSDSATTPASTGTTGALASASTELAVGLLVSVSASGSLQGVPSNSYSVINHVTLASGNIEIQTLAKIGSLTSGGESSTATLSTSKRYGGGVAVFKAAAGVSPPVNTVAPVISGTTTTGSTLTSTTGTWTNTPTSYAYQWQSDAMGNSSYSNISGATSSTYVIGDVAWACNARCVVTASNSGGAGSGANSNVLGVVTHPTLTRVQAVAASSNAASAIAATWSQTTAAGNLLVALVAWSQSLSAPIVTAPAGWTGLSFPVVTDAPCLRVYYILNSAARSGSESFSLSSAHDATIEIREYSGTGTWALDHHGATANDGGSTAVDSNHSTNGSITQVGTEVWVGLAANRQQATTNTLASGGFLAPNTQTTSSATAGDTIRTVSLERLMLNPGTLQVTGTLSISRQWSIAYATFACQASVPSRTTIDMGVIYFSSSGATSTRTNQQAFMNQINGLYPKLVGLYRTWPSGLLFAGFASENFVTSIGATPLIGWEPNITCAAIVDGTHDTFLHASATLANTYAKQLYVRPLYEFNGDWEPYGVRNQPAGNSYAQFVTAWKYIHDLFAGDGVSNIKWVWNPNINDLGNYPFDACYPGDSYVDIVALDSYNQNTPWETYHQVLSTSYADITTLAPSKPLWICELGSAATSGVNTKADWYAQLQAALTTSFPNIVSINYFNEVGTHGDMTIDSSGADAVSRARFKSMMTTGPFGFVTNPPTELAGHAGI